MSLSPAQITIAITVYDRRQYLKQAIASALDQTCPVQVMVVEDCGPDQDLEKFVKAEFGEFIRYIRNPMRRGLFGNWNACLELCQTKWISILHDDDFLDPCFVETMIDLKQKASDSHLFFGTVAIVNAKGEIENRWKERAVVGDWMRRDLKDILYSPFPFPGHMFPVEAARRLGGFRETSLLAGDWEMWAKLIVAGGAAQSAKVVAYCRDHDGPEKGTNQVIRHGRLFPAALIQHKRILALIPNRPCFDRRAVLNYGPLPTRFLLRFGWTLKPRLLRYYIGLLLLSKAPHLRYRFFQACAMLGGPLFVRAMSKMWNMTKIPLDQENFNSLR